jgi:hypothetical protein
MSHGFEPLQRRYGFQKSIRSDLSVQAYATLLALPGTRSRPWSSMSRGFLQRKEPDRPPIYCSGSLIMKHQVFRGRGSDAKSHERFAREISGEIQIEAYFDTGLPPLFD